MERHFWLSFSQLITILVINVVNVTCDYSPSVIIVGAGAAGISAAAKLFQNNITNIKILEAGNRIGGRIYSVHFSDATVELGAEFCHGEKGNIVYELASKYDLLEPLTVSYNFYHSSGNFFNKSLSNELFDLFSVIHENGVENQLNSSFEEYMLKRGNEVIMERYNNNERLVKYARALLDFYIKSVTAYEGAFSPNDLPLGNHYEESEGNQIIAWKKDGYKTILNILTKKYPNPQESLPVGETILLNKKVVKIIWNVRANGSSKTVIVKSWDGSVYEADHVIFTPSLGVLKNSHFDIFEPYLPQEKINAIEKLGFGTASKIYLHYPERWWPINDTNFILIWDEEHTELVLEEFPYGPARNGKSWLLDITGFFSLSDTNPNVLVVWLSGQQILDIEQLSDEVIRNGFTYILRKFLGNYHLNITKPDRILRHNWYSDRNFHGTYSYETVDSYKEDKNLHEVLLQPLMSNDGMPNLLFAGEATHPIYYSTVHGAIETGLREANRIIDLKKSKNYNI